MHVMMMMVHRASSTALFLDHPVVMTTHDTSYIIKFGARFI